MLISMILKIYNMKKQVLSVVILLISISTYGQNKFFTISGKVNGTYSDLIYLSYGKSKDSVNVINNKFEFKINELERPQQGWLNLTPTSTLAWLWVENSNIEIEIDLGKRIQNNGENLNFLTIKTIKGSHSENIKREYQEFYQSNMMKDNFADLLFEKLKNYFKKNGGHPFSGTILSELAFTKELTKDKLNQLYPLIDITQQDEQELELLKKALDKIDNYAIGNPFYKFKLPDINGKQIVLESYIGKITLIDFWASWCGPCRANHPDLIELNKKFKNKNFNIISISQDENKKSWLEAVKNDNLSWTNLIDQNKEIINELGIEAIPFNFLLDEKNNILGINLTIEQIEKILNNKESK